MLSMKSLPVALIPLSFIVSCVLSCSGDSGAAKTELVVLEISSDHSDTSIFESEVDWGDVMKGLEDGLGHYILDSKFICLVSFEGGVLQTPFDFEDDFEEWVSTNEVKETVQWMYGSEMRLGGSNSDSDPSERQITSVKEVSDYIHSMHGVSTVVHPDYVEVKPRIKASK